MTPFGTYMLGLFFGVLSGGMLGYRLGFKHGTPKPPPSTTMPKGQQICKKCWRVHHPDHLDCLQPTLDESLVQAARRRRDEQERYERERYKRLGRRMD